MDKTVATKPAFRTAYKKRLCLKIADTYYEWVRDDKEKQPILYEVDGGMPFAFAGPWGWWPGPEGKNEPIESCTIITTDANELASEVHDRTPVILDAKDYDAWLACKDVPLVPFSAKRMTARPVNRYVNNVRNQAARIRPNDWRSVNCSFSARHSRRTKVANKWTMLTNAM